MNSDDFYGAWGKFNKKTNYNLCLLLGCYTDSMTVIRHILSMTVWLLFAVPASGQTTVHFASDNWPPFLITDQQGELSSGIVVDLIELIFARLPESEAIIHNMPWLRVQARAGSGKIDAIAGLLYSKEREGYLQFTAPLFQSPIALFYSGTYHHTGPQWASPKDLAGYRIGILLGDPVYERLKESWGGSAETKVTQVATSGLLFKMLKAGRLDLVVINELTGKSLALKYGLSTTLAVDNRPLWVENYYLGFSRQSPQVKLIPRINQILEELRSEGVIREVFRRNLSSWERDNYLPSPAQPAEKYLRAQ